jgi:hypothetical protein
VLRRPVERFAQIKQAPSLGVSSLKLGPRARLWPFLSHPPARAELHAIAATVSAFHFGP